MKLTTLQAETLLLINDKKVFHKKYGYGAWRINGASPQAVGRLISMGLAEWGEYTPDWDIVCTITPAGRAALAQGGE